MLNDFEKCLAKYKKMLVKFKKKKKKPSQVFKWYMLFICVNNFSPLSHAPEQTIVR